MILSTWAWAGADSLRPGRWRPAAAWTLATLPAHAPSTSTFRPSGIAGRGTHYWGWIELTSFKWFLWAILTIFTNETNLDLESFYVIYGSWINGHNINPIKRIRISLNSLDLVSKTGNAVHGAWRRGGSARRTGLGPGTPRWRRGAPWWRRPSPATGTGRTARLQYRTQCKLYILLDVKL